MKRIRQTSVVGALVLALIAGASVQAALSDERVVREILVEQSPEETVVRVVADGAIRYAVSEHQGPHRLLLELADATLVGPAGSISVDNGQVGDILSVSMDDEGRRSSRVALELAEGARFQVSSHEGTVEIRIAGEPTDRLMAQAAPSDATASDAAPAASSGPAANEVGNVAYQHGGGGAGNARHVVVLGHPVAPVAPALDVLRQVKRARQGLHRGLAHADWHQIEYGKRNHVGLHPAGRLEGRNDPTLPPPARLRIEAAQASETHQPA
jgi:hypothetical protein